MDDEKVKVLERLLSDAHNVWSDLGNKTRMLGVHFHLSKPQLIAFCLGHMNYQVENGGWSQWVSNGYVEEHRACIESLLAVGTNNAHRVIEMIRKVVSYTTFPDDNNMYDYHELDEEYDFEEEALCDEYYTFNEELMYEINDCLQKLTEPTTDEQREKQVIDDVIDYLKFVAHGGTPDGRTADLYSKLAWVKERREKRS